MVWSANQNKSFSVLAIKHICNWDFHFVFRKIWRFGDFEEGFEVQSVQSSLDIYFN